MAIHWYPDEQRFRDERGRFVSQSRAFKSSTVRNEYGIAKALGLGIPEGWVEVVERKSIHPPKSLFRGVEQEGPIFTEIGEDYLYGIQQAEIDEIEGGLTSEYLEQFFEDVDLFDADQMDESYEGPEGF